MALSPVWSVSSLDCTLFFSLSCIGLWPIRVYCAYALCFTYTGLCACIGVGCIG